MKHKTVFISLLLQLILALVIVALVVGMMMFRYNNRLLREQKQASNMELLSQTKKIVEQALDEVEQSANSLVLNIDVQKSFLFNWNREDNFTYLKKTADLFLERIHSSHYLDSISLYSQRNEKIISGSGISEFQLSPYRFIIEQFIESKDHSSWTASHVVQPTGETEDVITYMLRFSTPSSGERGVLVINLKESVLYHAVINTNRGKLGNVAILDTNGEIISHYNKSLLRSGLDPLLLGQIRASGNQVLTVKMDGVPTLVSSLDSENTAWTYLAMMPQSELFDFSGRLVALSLSVSLTALLVGSLLMLLVSRRYYEPVRRMVADISSYWERPAPEKPYRNEFSYIRDSLHRLHDENKTYQARFKEQLVLMQDRMLLHLLTGNITEEEAARQREDYAAIGLSSSRFIVLALRIHSSASAPGYEEADGPLRFVVADLCEHLLQPSGGVYISNFLKRDVLILNAGEEAPHRRALRLAEELSEQIRARLGRNVVSIGIGGVCDGLPGIALSYQEANEALLYERFGGAVSIIAVEELRLNRPNRNRVLHYHRQTERVIEELKAGHAAQALQLQEQLIRSLGEDPDAGYSLKNLVLSHLLNSIIMLRMEQVEEERPPGEDEDQLYGMFNRLQTLDELHHWFSRLIADTAEKLQSKRRNSNNEVMRMLVRHVEEHYREPVSLQTLSDLAHMNQQYISRLFKEMTGTAFIDYLTGIRFREACRLLVETDRPVVEIAESTGFGQKQNLFRIFRKYTGLTPGEYRKQAVLKRLREAPEES